jgi:hypothetical protein
LVRSGAVLPGGFVMLAACFGATTCGGSVSNDAGLADAGDAAATDTGLGPCPPVTPPTFQPADCQTCVAKECALEYEWLQHACQCAQPFPCAAYMGSGGISCMQTCEHPVQRSVEECKKQECEAPDGAVSPMRPCTP